MQVICTDGTVLQCDRFEAIDSGVLLFDQERGRQESMEAEEEEADEEEAEADEEASAFVPLHQLRFVLPDDVRPDRATGQQTSQPTPQPPTQTPPMGGAPQQGQMPPQQPPSGQPPQQGGPGQGPGSRQRRR